MQYVGRAFGSVSKTWNQLNPATLTGAIDVIVVEQENGDLCCSPFHVRFGILAMVIRPSQKKVIFTVNGRKVDLAMKLGEGGEAFFVFETEEDVPSGHITSPVMSPSSSPSYSPKTPDSVLTATSLQEPEFLDLSNASGSPPLSPRSVSSDTEEYLKQSQTPPPPSKRDSWSIPLNTIRSASPPVSRERAIERVRELTRRLTNINIPSKITDNGDILLDMTGYKSGEEEIKNSEKLVSKILAEELGINDPDIVIGLDAQGHVRILNPEDNSSEIYEPPSPDSRPTAVQIAQHSFASDSALPLSAGEDLMPSVSQVPGTENESVKRYVKTLRLTSEQLKSLNLKPGANDITFSVYDSKALCAARMFYWSYKDPIVISDIDGTITKSDALGHVLPRIGRDWSHMGVANLFTDISSNGYNIMYLTARSVGQADSTRSYLKSVDQNGNKLPDGPVILSPDRTIAALRREVILRKPEAFKMACLADIRKLYGYEDTNKTPFYAGFGNRITDAFSYRSAGVPSSKIFTINSNSEVHMEMLELAGYKSSYIHIKDLVDHFFPPVSVGSAQIDQTFTDANFWRDPILEVDDLDDLSSDESTHRGRSPGNDQDDYDEQEDEDYEPDEEDEEDDDEDEDGEDDEVDDDISIDKSSDARDLVDNVDVATLSVERLQVDMSRM